MFIKLPPISSANFRHERRTKNINLFFLALVREIIFELKINFETSYQLLNRRKKFPWVGVERMRAGMGGSHIIKGKFFPVSFSSS